jgi:UDP-3-O-acyl-N-acetylglucosamine deacetylase
VIGHRYQRTLAGPAEVPGVGFITGAAVRVRLLPAPAGTGVVFRRTDRPGSPSVPARVTHVTDTRRRTTLGDTAAGVTLVEHLLATLAGLRVDNCVVELNGPEPPGLDGSAAGFVAAVAVAGIETQRAERLIWTPDRPVTASSGGATITLHPAECSRHPPCADSIGTRRVPATLKVSYILDYGFDGAIPRQTHTLDVRPENVVSEVANCRTFLTEAEARQLREQGVGAHLTAAEVLVFGSRGPINNRLRFADEPARHKVLDLIGDLSLCGFDLAGHAVAYRSGHALNVELARRLVALAEDAPRRAAA